MGGGKISLSHGGECFIGSHFVDEGKRFVCSAVRNLYRKV